MMPCTWIIPLITISCPKGYILILIMFYDEKIKTQVRLMLRKEDTE